MAWFHALIKSRMAMHNLQRRAEAGLDITNRAERDANVNSSWRQFFNNFAFHLLELGLMAGVAIIILVAIILLA